MSTIGSLIVFEGPDGSGKSTLAAHLTEYLSSLGVACEYLSFPGNEPSTLGRLVNDLHHESENFGLSQLNPTSLQLLHIAAHVDTISTRILPAISEGKTVILDRFWWSTWVYGRASSVTKSSLSAMLSVEWEQWGSLLPSIVFLISGEIPKRKHESLYSWKRHLKLYLELATEQHSRHPVELVTNSGSIDDALVQIIEAFENYIWPKQAVVQIS